jgi:hypothetical protein
MNTDLREKFDKLLNDYGNYIIYVRTNKNLHCKCWNPQQESSNPKCPICFGTGFVVKVEIRKARSRSASTPVSYPNLMQHEEPAITDDPGYFFYMRWDSNPKTEDIIIDVSWNNGIPTFTNAYEINFPEPLRGKGGRIEYWRLACRAKSSREVYINGLKRYNIRLRN